MEELNFRVIHVPTKNYASKEKLAVHIRQCANKLSQQLEECGLREVAVNVLKVKKSESEDYPEIEELVYEVQAKYRNLSKCTKCQLYQEFLRKWIGLFNKVGLEDMIDEDLIGFKNKFHAGSTGFEDPFDDDRYGIYNCDIYDDDDDPYGIYDFYEDDPFEDDDPYGIYDTIDDDDPFEDMMGGNRVKDLKKILGDMIEKRRFEKNVNIMRKKKHGRSPAVILHESESFVSTRRSCHTSNAFKSVALGVLTYDGEFHEFVSLVPKIPGSGSVDFFHDTREAKIKLSDDLEFKFSYSKIRNIFVNVGSNPREIFFDLCEPPMVFLVEQKQRIDSLSFSHRRFVSYVINRRVAVNGPIDVDTFGRSNVIRLSLVDLISADEIIGRIHSRCGKKPVFYANIESVPKESPPKDVRLDLPHFGCVYLLTAIFKRNFTMASQTANIGESLRVLKRLSAENAGCLEKALTLVLAAVDSGKVVNFWHAVETQYRYYISHRDEIDFAHYVVPEKCRLIRRVTLTPSRQLLWAPEIMSGNRVLRHFDAEFALRVSFRDDNNSRLSFNAAYAAEEVFELAIRRPTTYGIHIGDRNYEFLAWSNSQIRDHGIWMYARDGRGNTVRQIRSWMGNFSHIRSVPKYMSRMGQCFSQTEDAVSVPLDTGHVRTEEDIEGGRDRATLKPYCFSDGVGRISSRLAAQVHEVLGHDKLCSAFQIRYGGYKGMLVVDPTLRDVDIVFRKSMKKFDSPQNIRLEIAKTSAPVSLQLNRPFITILNDMGVRHRTFQQLQEDMLKTLTDMLFEEKKAAAFLESKTPNELFEYRELSDSGIYLTTEPFFRSLLLALHRHHVEKIKTRANIAIDPSDGRNMLGVLDETGTLEAGQVFVQYTRDISCGETSRDTVIVQREVLVTKNPCMLPGDVRKFVAVDVPQLRHIVDCIVFPQKGPRPHSNEMAGSDMDGDEYAVLWKDNLIFHRSNYPPGDFPSSPEMTKTIITESDMIDFLITYIKNDQVGTIANAHLAHADHTDIFSPTCLAIAKKFSFAVDYAKTGGPSRHLEPQERPAEFPDFMEKTHKECYKSEKALGKMFRCVHDYESENEHASVEYHDVRIDEDLKYHGWEKYKESAIQSKNKFNTLLKTVLRNYGIQHEAEVFSGAFTNLHCRFQERKDRDEIEKVVVRCIKRLAKSFGEEFHEEFKDSSVVRNIDVEVLKKASAWYVVTYGDKDAKFLSFPWTVSKYLALIKLGRNINEKCPVRVSPIVVKMDEQIKVCESQNLLPYPLESDIPRGYDVVCDDPDTVRLALRVMILWAQDEQIIERPGHDARGLLYTKTFVDLFYHVAELARYVVKRGGGGVDSAKGKHFSAASLCLEFFKFCLKLRFYNKHEVKALVPFPLYKHSVLSKRAVVTFHAFAVSGKFQTIYFDPVGVENEIEMKPIQIESKIFPSAPIGTETLQRAREALEKYSRSEVSLREIRQTKKVVVIAKGSEQSLKALKSLLRKKHVYLRQLFTTGVLPADL